MEQSDKRLISITTKSPGLFSLEELLEESDPRASYLDQAHEHIVARSIMENNMIGIPEVKQVFGTLGAVDQFDHIPIPFSADLLERSARTHVLVADTGLSLQTLCRRSHLPRLKRIFDHCEFVHRTDTPTWRLIRLNVPADSFEKTTKDQRLLLSEQDRLLSARQVVYAAMVVFGVFSFKLLNGQFTRTYDHDHKSRRVIVGPFNEHRIRISPWYGGDRHRSLGLLTCRAPDCPRLIWTPS